MKLWNRTKASSGLVYALIIGLIAVVAISAVAMMGGGVDGVLTKVGGGISGGAACKEGVIEGYSHGIISHSSAEISTKPGTGTPPAHATSYYTTASILCINGTASVASEEAIATACDVEYHVDNGACVRSPLAPLNLALPTISGNAVITSVLTAAPGSWKSFPDPVFTYQWLRDGTPIAAATDSTYTIVAEDGNRILSVRVTATNDSGQATATSAATGSVTAAPANTALPVISGLNDIGATLSLTPGTWTGTPVPTYTYQWLRDGADIAGATQTTYVTTSTDGNTVISVRETATNSVGTNSVESLPTDAITAVPANTALPVVSGTTDIGSTLSVTDGSWTGTPTPSFTYRWLRDGIAISGATSNSYQIDTADGNHVLSGEVTATNVKGSTSAVSAPTASVSAAPANTALPVISGTQAVGQTLTASNGSWTGTPAPSFTYQWLRGGSPIGGATSNSYALTNADAGEIIAFSVTATNSVGSATATSNATGQTQYGPINTALPSISGSPVVGQSLSANPGSWNGFPAPSFAYQWNGNGSPISGATNSSYTPAPAVAGQTLTVTVTASNTQGSATSTSAATAAVEYAPTVSSAPTISGTPTVGQTLTTSNGSWAGYPAPSYAYQWNRGGSPISGATSSSYTLDPADGAQTITATVTASNSQGSASSTSSSVGPVASTPANTSLPTISGSVAVGATLTAGNGSWSGYPAPSYSYQWNRAGSPISGATASTYTIVTADSNNALTVTVTASNAAGSAAATSAATTVVPVSCNNTTQTFTTVGTTAFNIPDGCNTATITILAGGGGGGGANESGSGSAAGGGGSGGCYLNSVQTISAGTGRTGSVTIGAAGAGGLNGGTGGTSSISLPGISLSATGGVGAPFKGSGAFATSGGAGGSPGGSTGGGRQGTSGESAIGGNGASSCGGLGTGGNGGQVGGYSSANAYGKAATGYGAGGGGAGNQDRTSPNQWTGGAGSQGYGKVVYSN